MASFRLREMYPIMMVTTGNKRQKYDDVRYDSALTPNKPEQ